MNKKLHITFISSYPPRECGIGTFTSDLSKAVAMNPDISYDIIAINNIPEGYSYPKEVVFEIYNQNLDEYKKAAEFINASKADLVVLQHEFGLFGGYEGRNINELLSRLKKPVVSTMHTILRERKEGYREATLDIVNYSEKVVVLADKGVEILASQMYGVDPKKVQKIHHGVPDMPFIDPNFFKDKFNLDGKLVLLTFGLLNPNKGIENVIEALPEVVKDHPEVVYLVAGATHPEVKKQFGEEYRQRLESRVKELGLEKNVIFINKFLSLEELTEYIGASDVNITPYHSAEQIVSGSLAYVVGMGKAVISTPYIYATELLKDERGILVDFKDVKGMGQAILKLVTDDRYRTNLRKNAYALGREMVWKEVGKRYVELFEEVLLNRSTIYHLPSTKLELPRINLNHLKTLTDEVGIIQHGVLNVPDRRFGYSTDDVGRALAFVLDYYQTQPSFELLKMAKTYLSFLYQAQTEDGVFHNFMNYQRDFLDTGGESEDTLGRAVWGLGKTVELSPSDEMRSLAQNMFEKALPKVEKLSSPHGIAYSIIGLSAYLSYYPGALNYKKVLISLTNKLLKFYSQQRSVNWHWVIDVITYDSAKIPQALLLSYEFLGNQKYLDAALKILEFLTEAQFNGKYFDLIGNQGWYPKMGQKSVLSQQPLDAASLVECYLLAYQLVGSERYRELAYKAFSWFMGNNRLALPLYDPTDGASHDGLDPQGVNKNKGAESTICMLIALHQLHKLENLEKKEIEEVPELYDPESRYIAYASDITPEKES